MAESSREGQEGNVSTREFGPRLCDYCDKMFRALDNAVWLENEGEQQPAYHPTMSSLCNAVRSGCQLCIMLEHQIRKHDYYDLEGLCSNENLNSGRYLGKVHWEKPRLKISRWRYSNPLITIALWFGSRSLLSPLASIRGHRETHFAYPGTSSKTF